MVEPISLLTPTVAGRTLARALDYPALLLKAFSDPVRLRLLNLLVDREVCVCDLHEALALPQPTVSRHLAHLRRIGLVVARKDGLWMRYRLAQPATDLHRGLLDCLGSYMVTLDVLQTDRRRLDQLLSSRSVAPMPTGGSLAVGAGALPPV